MNKSRLEAFTDAVIAIIMTILVLELARPDSDTWESLAKILPHVGVYFISFIMLAVYWVNHHHLLQSINKINGKVLWINMFFLFVLSLMPFVSNWVSHYLNSFVPELCYVILLTLANLTYYLLTRELLNINKSKVLGTSTIIKNRISLLLNLLSIVLGYFIAPIIMLLMSIFIFSLWIIPDKNVEEMLG